MSTQPPLPLLGEYVIPAPPPRPVCDRPATRLYAVGPGGLALHELLALLIGGPQASTAAQALLARYPGLDQLRQATLTELAAVTGLGRPTAQRLQAALELGRRSLVADTTERPPVNTTLQAVELLLPLVGFEDREVFAALYLNTRCRCVGAEVLYRGTLNTSVVRPAEIFRRAAAHNAAAVIVGHNHPSRDPSPSPEDVALTRKLVQGGRVLDLSLLDHLVIGHASRWVSLRERGLGFEDAPVVS